VNAHGDLVVFGDKVCFLTCQWKTFRKSEIRSIASEGKGTFLLAPDGNRETRFDRCLEVSCDHIAPCRPRSM